MGYVADFVRAPHRTADEVVAAQEPRNRWDGIEGPPGLETMHLARLWCLATSKSSEEQFDEVDEQLLENHCEGDDGSWGVVLPQSFRDLLAGISETERGRLATAWSKSGEIALDDIEPEAILAFLPQLCALCQRAKSHSEQIILRVGE